MSLTKNDVFSVSDGRFYLDGKPYAELSYNLFDLFWNLYGSLENGEPMNEDNAMYQHSVRCLKELSENGFRTIRIFAKPFFDAPFNAIFADKEKRETIFFKAVDTALDLCDKYGIRVVYCLAVATFYDHWLNGDHWDFGEEHMRELFRDENSRGRRRLYEYLEAVIGRYKGRKTIVMWELSNEMTLEADIQPPDGIYNGQRMPTLKDVATFQNEVAGKIKELDPLRMVNNGGSILRDSQWNLYHNKRWAADTLPEHIKAFDVIYKDTKLDVVDIHYYGVLGTKLKAEDDSDYILGIKEYKDIAERYHLPLLIGEYGVLPAPKTDAVWQALPDYFEHIEEPAADKFIKQAVDIIVDSGAQLTYWWAYRNEHNFQKNYYDITPERTPFAFNYIKEGNRRLKEKLGIK